MSRADKGKSDREKKNELSLGIRTIPLFFLPSFILRLEASLSPSLSSCDPCTRGLGGGSKVAQERAPGTSRREDIKGSTQCGERGDGVTGAKCTREGPWHYTHELPPFPSREPNLLSCLPPTFTGCCSQ